MRPDDAPRSPVPILSNGQDQTLAEVDPSPDRNARVRRAALAALTVAALALCAALAWPLLHAITRGTALAVLAWPLHARVARRLGRPGLAALSSTAGVVALILVPLVLVTTQAAKEVAELTTPVQGHAAGGGLRERVARSPAVDWAIGRADDFGIDLDALGREAAQGASRGAAEAAAASAHGAIQGLLAVVVLFFLLRDQAAFAAGLRGLLPLSGAEAGRVMRRAADAVHANLYANVLTSLIDAAGAALVFWAAEVPTPVLWGAVTFLVTLLPLVGSAGVWVPAAALLALSGRGTRETAGSALSPSADRSQGREGRKIAE